MVCSGMSNIPLQSKSIISISSVFYMSVTTCMLYIYQHVVK
jgi:hypothetical protein